MSKSAAPAGMATGAAPLLEREQELGALERLLGPGDGGDARVVVVEGPAGIGKSRLIAELRVRAAGAGARVLAAHGTDLERELPFGLVRQLAAFQGEEADGRELLRPMRELGPAIDTLEMGPPANLAELAMDPPDPLPFVLDHQLLEIPSAAAIDDLVEVAGPDSGAALTMVQLRHMGGALAREAPGAGARATLPGDICFVGLGVVHDQQPAVAVEASLEAVEGALGRHHAGFYPNFVEEPTDASAFFDRETWARLREVKALYDPQDLFRGNHHVPPAAREEVAA